MYRIYNGQLTVDNVRGYGLWVMGYELGGASAPRLRSATGPIGEREGLGASTPLGDRIGKGVYHV